MDDNDWIPVVRKGRGPPTPRNRFSARAEHDPAKSFHTDEFVTILLCETENKLASINKLRLTKEIRNTLGEIDSMKFIAKGNLLLKLRTKEQQAAAMKIKSLCSVKVKAELPRYLRENRGVIFGVPKEISIEGMKSELESSGIKVEQVERIYNKKLSQHTNTTVIDFGQNTRPDSVVICFQKYRVQPYVRQPIRCFKCQKFGHGSESCRSSRPTCPHCAEVDHQYENCPNKEKTPTCSNCGRGHSAGYRQCEKYIEAKNVEKNRALLKCTYRQAFKYTKEQNSPYNQTGEFNKNTTDERTNHTLQTNNINTCESLVGEKTHESQLKHHVNPWGKNIPQKHVVTTDIEADEKATTDNNINVLDSKSTLQTESKSMEDLYSNIAGLVGFALSELVKGKLKTPSDVIGCVALGAKSVFNHTISGNQITEHIEKIKRTFSVASVSIPQENCQEKTTGDGTSPCITPPQPSINNMKIHTEIKESDKSKILNSTTTQVHPHGPQLHNKRPLSDSSSDEEDTVKGDTPAKKSKDGRGNAKSTRKSTLNINRENTQ